MKHIALYRKYRPDTFEKLVDQDHVSQTLINQIKESKLSHAYLFSGPRGTGKTTTAKIISRVVNCLNPEKYNPCNLCESCKQILSDSFLDVIEMDAASHNGVDDIREITDGVKFPPSLGKKKVIIIDEVHMLSKGAFNALLKTLEEPPEYMIFILATTEPNKIPQTIVSRCQRFDFKRISVESMAKYLRKISKNENIDISDDALKSIALQAGGAMRDALSLLEQVSGSGIDKINTEKLSEVLGSAEDEVYMIIKYLLASDLKSVYEISSSLYSGGKDIKIITRELLEALRKALLFSEGVSNNISKIEPEESEFFEKIGAKGRKNLFLLAIEEFISLSQNRFFENEWAGFEYVLGRICTKPEKDNFSHLNSKIEELEYKIIQLESRINTGIPLDSSISAKKISEKNESKDINIPDDENKEFFDIERIEFPEVEDEINFYQEDFSIEPDANLKNPDLKAENKINKKENNNTLEEKDTDFENIQNTETDYTMIKEKWENIMDIVFEKNKAAYSILKKTELVLIKDGILKLGVPQKLKVLAKSFGAGGTGDILKQAVKELCNLEINIEVEIKE